MEADKNLIIMVDDNHANLRMGKNLLSEKFSVATALSAERLFSLLEKNTPALILLDVDMPGINGYDTLKILKSKPETAGIPVVFLTARSEIDAELKGLSLGAVDYITKPIQPQLLLKRIEIHMQVAAQAAELKYLNDNLQKMVQEKTNSIMELQTALLRTMAELVEYRDDITGRHIERTQCGIRILLENMKANNQYQDETKDWDVEELVQSSQLHDVGKIFISDNILRKPGKLSFEEIEDMKVHTHIGRQIVEKVEKMTKVSSFLENAKIFAASHHEKWDGSGYPNQLKGNDIPLLGRIMAIVDAYDALVSVRPHKKAYTHADAVKIISEGKGTQFDPSLVDIFLKLENQFREI